MWMQQPLAKTLFFWGSHPNRAQQKYPVSFFINMTESEQLWGSSGYLGAAATVILTALVRDFGDFFSKKLARVYAGRIPFSTDGCIPYWTWSGDPLGRNQPAAGPAANWAAT